MAKSSKGTSSQREARTPAAPKKFSDRNIAAVNPNSNQFPPTEGKPISPRKQMAGY